MKTPSFYLLILLPLAISTLAGCAVIDFMPTEIQAAEKPSIDGAAKFEAEHPGASHFYSVHGRTIHYVELTQQSTERPLIIFVHGSPGLWRSWVRYLNDPDLQRRANMISLDRPGFGASGSGTIERGLAEQSRDIAPLLEHAQPGQRVILVGHAWSGALIARIAMSYPGQITDLVLMASPLDPTLQKESWFQYAADWPPITWLLPRELVVFNREYLGLESELTEMLPLWPNMTQRVSVLLGEQDEEVPLANADFVERKLTHASSMNIVRMPGTNHFIPWTRFERVKAEILSHLGPP